MGFRTFLGFLLVSVCFILEVEAQHKELAVPSLAQRTDKWCWAASMEMIMKYHQFGSGTSQCDLAFQRYDVGKTFPTFSLSCGTCDCAPHCDDEEPCDPTKYSTNNCIQTLNFTWKDQLGSLTFLSFNKGYYDMLFTNNGYYSMEDYKLLDWDSYKNEIDQCRPVIFLYSITGKTNAIDLEAGTVNSELDNNSFEESFLHATVGKGYTTLSGSDYFMVNDPWNVCKGETYLLNTNVLSGTVVPTNSSSPTPAVLKVHQMKSMVHHIYPKGINCSACDSIPEEDRYIKIEESPLMTHIRRHADAVPAIALGDQFSSAELEAFDKEGNFSTPVHYFSYGYFNNPKLGKLDFNEAVLQADIREMTYSLAKPKISARIRCSTEGKFCAVEKIGLVNAPITQTVLLPKGDTIALHNDPYEKAPLGYPVINYSIVRYPPTTFEWYRFEYEGETYYYPTEIYTKQFFYGQEYIDAQIAIPEDLILQGLEKYTQDYDTSKILEKPPRVQEEYKKILETSGFLKMGKYLLRRKFRK